MHSIASEIRKLYRPIQPTVSHVSEAVSYAEYLPDSGLQELIYCYWELKTTSILQQPFVYNVVADGCIDLFFDLDNPDESLIMGFSGQSSVFELGKSFHYAGIRFFPAMFTRLFRADASELTGRCENLEDVLPKIFSKVRSHLGSKKIKEQLPLVFDRLMLDLCARAILHDDPRLYRALLIMLKNADAVKVQKDLDTGISPRQLRRLFDYHIGDSPKALAKIIRFQKLLGAMDAKTHDLPFFEAGYYDQAHFTKEFKLLYGVTPGALPGK